MRISLSITDIDIFRRIMYNNVVQKIFAYMDDTYDKFQYT